MQYVVRTASQDLISRQPRHLAARLSLGAPVWCTWDTAHAHVFGEQQAHLVIPDPADPAAADNK
jgi:hypothetical protein